MIRLKNKNPNSFDRFGSQKGKIHIQDYDGIVFDLQLRMATKGVYVFELSRSEAIALRDALTAALEDETK